MRSLKKQEVVVNGFTVKPIRGSSWKVTGKGIQFSLCQIGERRWRLAYQTIDGFDKVRKKRKLEVEERDDAISEAETFLLGSPEPDRTFTIEGVLNWWMDRRTCGKNCVADYDGHNERFIRWATERGLSNWSDLRWEHIQDYANGLARSGRRERTIEAYTYTIRAASKKAAQNWPERFRDFAAGYEQPKADGPKEQETKSLEWVAGFVLWLRDQPEGWKVLPGVALQGFLALRVEETLRLTWDRVDFAKGTITVDGETKNQFSRRILPMNGLLRMILQEAPKEADRVVSTYRGKDAWRNALRGATKKDRKGKTYHEDGFMESYEPGSYIPPKNFRKVLSTEAEERLWNDRVLDDFYGHSRKGTRRRFYSVRDMQKMIAVFRSEVTDKVDEVLAEFTAQWRREAGEVLSLRPLVPGFVPGSGNRVTEGLS